MSDPTGVTAAKTISIRRHPWDSNTVIAIELRPMRHSNEDEWEVYANGQKVGEVGKYTGTLDRPTHRGSRIRVEGKRRTLWSHRPASVDGYSQRESFGDVSRAEAIRVLLSIAEYRAVIHLDQAPTDQGR